MAVTATWYGQGLAHVLRGDVDLPADTIKVALVTSAYTPNIDTHDYWDDVSANEAAGTGYTAGGATLANKTVTYDAANNRAIFDNTVDTVWSTATVTARYAVIYKDTGTPGTSPLLGYVDFGQDESANAGDFTIQWSADGILRLTAV